MTMHRTRIKFCGITRAEDMRAAVAAGVDAVGFVFFAKCARYVSPVMAAELMREVPSFVSTVGLFVNATAQEVTDAVAIALFSLLLFLGVVSLEECCDAAHAVNRPFLRAIRIKPDTAGDDLLKYEERYRAASKLFAGLLLDTWTDAYGGAGKVFNWSLIPEKLAPRVVLSGGLSAQNVAEALMRVRPHALDVSSVIELSKNNKETAKKHTKKKTERTVDNAIQGGSEQQRK